MLPPVPGLRTTQVNIKPYSNPQPSSNNPRARSSTTPRNPDDTVIGPKINSGARVIGPKRNPDERMMGPQRNPDDRVQGPKRRGYDYQQPSPKVIQFCCQ